MLNILSKCLLLSYLVDSKNLLAIGDCCDTDEEKMATKASEHAVVVAHNREKLVNSKAGGTKHYEPSARKLMIVSIGRKNAVFQAGPFSLSGCVPVRIKAKDLYIKRFRKMLGH